VTFLDIVGFVSFWLYQSCRNQNFDMSSSSFFSLSLVSLISPVNLIFLLKVAILNSVKL
jgi:hypothetical protein